MKRVAFLVYTPKNQRRADNSFDGNDNIGALVIADTLRRAGIDVGFVTPESAHIDADIVLVSLTSTHDVYALLLAVSKIASWSKCKRKFKVIAGGFGMQNPIAIRSYIDYAAFGRAHEWIADIVRLIIDNQYPKHSSLMDMEEFNSVTMWQGELYPYAIGKYKETFTGCPAKCKFCQFTFARKHNKGSDDQDNIYFQGLFNSASPEVTWPQLLTWPKKAGRVRVGIDGFSERLRYLYGKRISNLDIIKGIEHMGSFDSDKATVLLVYNIVNFPGETTDDYDEFIDTIKEAKPKKRVIMVIQSTPFRPSLITPMQWEPATLTPDWSQRRQKVIIDRDDLYVVHSFTLESAWSHVKSIVVERATFEDDNAINAILFSPKLKKLRAAKALALFARHFDISKWVRERDIEAEPPAPFLSSNISIDILRKIARKMRDTRRGWHV